MAINHEIPPPVAEGDLRPTPQPDDTTRFYWDAAADGRLVLQRCTSCDRLQFPPDVVCTYCQSEHLDHAELSGRGILYSFAVMDRPFHPGFVSCVPYVVGLIELAEQPDLRILTNVVEADPRSLSVGMAMEVRFEHRGDVTLPQFRPEEIL
jgi:uncharacterized protein